MGLVVHGVRGRSKHKYITVTSVQFTSQTSVADFSNVNDDPDGKHRIQDVLQSERFFRSKSKYFK